MPDDEDPTWALAETEELAGDALFFTGVPGAAAHYRAAQAALMPPGQQWASEEESARRMEAFQRVQEKLYAIDPYGKPRPGHDARPHPNYRPPDPAPANPALAERREAALQLRQTNTLRESSFAKLFDSTDHWTFYRLADLWRDAGQALAPAHPAAARRAFAWSLYYFERYNRAWTAHLPASRWDSDGGQDMSEVQSLTDALPDRDPATVPDWVDRLLDGDWQAALAASGADASFPALTALIDEARQVSA